MSAGFMRCGVFGAHDQYAGNFFVFMCWLSKPLLEPLVRPVPVPGIPNEMPSLLLVSG